MAYTSKINLGGLGEQPKTQDPALFPDMADIYNALHILTQVLSGVLPGGGGSSGVPPTEAMRFLRSFQMPALVDISAGDLVTVFDAREYAGLKEDFPFPMTSAGVIKGGGGFLNAFGLYRGGITGFALNDAEVGNMVDIGIGPAVVNVSGARAGQLAYSRSAFDNLTADYVGNGQIFLNVWDTVTTNYAFQVIGVGIADDMLMIGSPMMTIPNYIAPEPPPPDTGGGGGGE